jgi:hypothetical protein
MIAKFLDTMNRSTSWPWTQEASARAGGFANDPRIIAAFAARRAALAQQHAALPAALAKEGISLLPR